MKWITRITRILKSAFMNFLNDTRAVAFDLMNIIFMAVAILLGNMGGVILSGYIGISGGLLGSFIIGAVIYAVYSFLTGAKMTIMNAVIFAVLVYLAGMATVWIGNMTGLTGGILSIIMEAVVLSMLWGYFGKGKSPLGTTQKPRRKGKRRR